MRRGETQLDKIYNTLRRISARASELSCRTACTAITHAGGARESR
jgi:hypothetical protein